MDISSYLIIFYHIIYIYKFHIIYNVFYRLISALKMSPARLGLLVPAVSLSYFAISSSPARHLAGLTERQEQGSDAFEANDFLLRSVVHLLADFYVTSVLAPRLSWLRFHARLATVFVTMAVYSWTLVAPKLLTNRSF